MDAERASGNGVRSSHPVEDQAETGTPPPAAAPTAPAAPAAPGVFNLDSSELARGCVR